MLDTLVHGIDRGIRSLSEIFYGPVGTYCKLETVDGDALVADDGSLITVLRLEGALKQVGVDEHKTIMLGLTEKLQATLSRPGHCIQVVFEYDPEASEGRIREILEPSRRTALNLGLDIGPLLENWGQALQRYCAIETCWLVLWTRPTVLAESLRKTALKERIASMSKAPVQPGCQQVSASVELMPKDYQAYHAERIESIREDPRRLCYDEAHRVTGNTSMAGQLLADMTTMARESRKWNLSIGLYTQSIDDIPKIIIELASTILILGAGTEQSIANMTERFGLNGACSYALAHLGKPGPAGSNLVAVFRTGAGKSQLVLSLTIGGQALWAFSTTTEDVTIRNHLYKRMEPSEALRRLAARFPGGSAKSEVERRRMRVTDQSAADDVLVNVIQEIVKELMQSGQSAPTKPNL